MVKTISFITSIKYHQILVGYFKDDTNMALNVCRKLILIKKLKKIGTFILVVITLVMKKPPQFEFQDNF